MPPPLYRLLSDHVDRFRGRYEDAFERRYGRWRWVVDTVVERFLACGVMEAGFARVRCDTCKAEYLLAFSCKTRYFCPSCHAKRLAERAVAGWTGDQKGTGRARAGVKAGRERVGGADGRVASAIHRRGERLPRGARGCTLRCVGLKFLSPYPLRKTMYHGGIGPIGEIGQETDTFRGIRSFRGDTRTPIDRAT